MIRPHVRRSLFFLLLSCIAWSGTAAATPSQKQLSQGLKFKIFKLKTDIHAFGSPRETIWSRRDVFHGKITLAKKMPDAHFASGDSSRSIQQGQYVLINGKKGWYKTYFVSKEAFVVTHVGLGRDAVTLQLDAVDKKTKRSLELKFTSLDGFDAQFKTIFFDDKEATEPYEREVDKFLIAKYFDPKVELSSLTADEKNQLLAELKSISTRGYPEIEIHDGKVFACLRLAPTPPNDSSYSDIYADKDKRVMTSAEIAMKEARSIVDSAEPRSPYLEGFVFLWDSSYIEPFEEKDEIGEKLRLRTTLPIFEKFEKGELSIVGVIEKSFLRVDGSRYYLTCDGEEDERESLQRNGFENPLARA